MESEQELRARARKRAEEKLGFCTHLAIYLFVNSLLFLIWWFGGDGFPWPLLVAGFWGIGLVAHAVQVYGSGRYADNMAEREYQRLKERK